MTTLFQIVLWTVLFIAVRVLSEKLDVSEIGLTIQESKNVRKGLLWWSVINRIALFVVILYASPYQDWVLDHVGGFIDIVAISILVMPRRLFKWLLIQTQKED